MTLPKKRELIERARMYYFDWASNDTIRSLEEMMADFVEDENSKTENHKKNLQSPTLIVMIKEVIEQIRLADIGISEFCDQVYGNGGVISDLKSYRSALPESDENLEEIDILIAQVEKQATEKIKTLTRD